MLNYKQLHHFWTVARAGGIVRGYPAIIDNGKYVTVRVEATADAPALALLLYVRLTPLRSFT